MCGIHGVVTGTKRETYADKFIQQGYIAGSLRGMDSSGFASINTASKDVAFQKMPLPGTMFMMDKYAARLANDACGPNMVSICHTRAATSGGVGLEQCHPFLVTGDDDRELIGVHNGSLTGWSTKPGGNGYKVDSEWALNHIFSEGYDAFEDFNGAFVFCWWDSAESEVFNIALNEARPIFVAFTADGNMLFASEAGMLFWLAERNNIKLDGSVKKLKAGFWYQFPIDKLKEWTKRQLPTPKAAATASTRYDNDWYRQYQRPNHCEDVQRLLDKLASGTPGSNIVELKPNTSGETPTNARNARYCTAKEVLLAKEAGYMRSRGEFLPAWDEPETGEIFGTFVDDETQVEFDAIIRNAMELDYKPFHDVWITEIIGVKDDGDKITVICTHPILRNVAQTV